MTDRQPHADLRSYGRRRARTPSARQQSLWREVLPRVTVPGDAPALADLPSLFSVPVREVWLLTHAELRHLARIRAVAEWLDRVFHNPQSKEA